MSAQETWSRRVLFVGDSFVAGVGDPTGLGWVGRVVAASFARAVGLTAYNLGVRMETSVQIAARWPAEAQPRLLVGTRGAVVFSFGANDTTPTDDMGVRVDTGRSLAALTAMLDDAARLGLPALVVGPPLAGDDAQHERVRELSGELRAACAQRHTRFIGVAERLPGDSPFVTQARAGDGAHPAAEGYAQLAELLVASGLVEWLDEATRAPGPTAGSR